MRKWTIYFCLGLVIALVGCNERKRISNSDYSVVHPQSWNPDGHPGIYLYYKGKELWFNVYCADYGYHDGILVFEGDVPDSLFNGTPPGNESADIRSPQMFVIRGAGPPVMISERILKQSLRTNELVTQHFSPAPNGLEITFDKADEATAMKTNITVSWEEIRAWLDEGESTAPILNSRMGKYRYLPLKRP